MFKRTGMILATVFAAASVHANETKTEIKIGYVDMQKALQTVEVGKKAKAELETEFNKKNKELQAEEASIRKMHEEFQKQASVLNEAARNKKQAEIQERFMKLQENRQKSQMEIQKKEQALTEPLIKKLRTLIKEMSEKKGYQLVLEKNENSVLYSLEKDDMTQDLITEFNKKK